MRWIDIVGGARGSWGVVHFAGSDGGWVGSGIGNGSCVRDSGEDFLISTIFNFFSITMSFTYSALGQAKSMAGSSNTLAV
jgi:hypothetical protein